MEIRGDYYPWISVVKAQGGNDAGAREGTVEFPHALAADPPHGIKIATCAARIVDQKGSLSSGAACPEDGKPMGVTTAEYMGYHEPKAVGTKKARNGMGHHIGGNFLADRPKWSGYCIHSVMG